jgi:hypothetical protein
VINEHLDVFNLGGGTDHRRRLLDELKVYYSPIDDHADANLALFFEAMTKATYAQDETIEVGGRALTYRRRAKGVIWFSFAELFEKPRSQVDYLEKYSSSFGRQWADQLVLLQESLMLMRLVGSADACPVRGCETLRDSIGRSQMLHFARLGFGLPVVCAGRRGTEKHKNSQRDCRKEKFRV